MRAERVVIRRVGGAVRRAVALSDLEARVALGVTEFPEGRPGVVQVRDPCQDEVRMD